MASPAPCALPCRCASAPALDLRLADGVDGPATEGWDVFTAGAGPFLQRPYLRALAAGAGGVFRFATFHQAGQLAGVAWFQLARFQGRSWTAPFRERRWLSFLMRRVGLDGDALSFRVLVCGDPAASGEHGFRFAPGVAPDQAAAALLRAFAAAGADLERGAPIDGFLVKDLPAGASPIGAALGHRGFARLGLEPAMVLRLDPSWDSFESYLACLTSKYRVKARRAYAKSQALAVRDLDAGDLLEHRERVAQLHRAVVERSDYRLGSLAFPAFLNLRRTLGPEFILRGYFHQGTLAGFLTAFVRGGVLEAHQVGLDYTLNPGLGIYPRMLCDFLRLALERRCVLLNFGRTAAEIKSTLGAVPVETCCYLRHRHCLPNHLAQWLAPRLQPAREPLRMPFTREWYQQARAALPAFGGPGAVPAVGR